MFIPPHCPNPDCEHYDSPTVQDWYGSIGQYSTKTFGTVPRFKCRSCRLGFSKQTFSIDYYAKRLLDYSYIYHKINDGAGLRKIGRDLHASCDSITNRINRMARNATLANRQIVNLLPLREDLVLDGLQNFCNSQFFPDNYTIAVGKDSQFVYECDYATIRRAGRMTTAQKKRREELEKRFRASRQSIEKSFTRVLRSIAMKAPKREIPLILYTDEKSDYRRSMWNDGADSREDVQRSVASPHDQLESREEYPEPSLFSELHRPGDSQRHGLPNSGDGSVSSECGQCDAAHESVFV
jgi:transposase-like protein